MAIGLCLLKLPIKSNAPEFWLLCSNYVPCIYVSQYSYAPQNQHFLSLKSQNHEYQLSLFIYFPNTLQFRLSS